MGMHLPGLGGTGLRGPDRTRAQRRRAFDSPWALRPRVRRRVVTPPPPPPLARPRLGDRTSDSFALRSISSAASTAPTAAASPDHGARRHPCDERVVRLGDDLMREVRARKLPPEPSEFAIAARVAGRHVGEARVQGSAPMRRRSRPSTPPTYRRIILLIDTVPARDAAPFLRSTEFIAAVAHRRPHEPIPTPSV